MPYNINQVTDEDSINPVDLHFTQNQHLNHQSHQQHLLLQQVQSQNQNHNQNQNGATKNKKLFPKKLWDLINDNKYHYCLRWSDDGQLVYLNRDDFEDSYLKTAENQFHTQKAISFVRQMNMYGFRKVDDCYYENDNFKRDSEHLLKNMIRKHPNKNQINDGGISPPSFHTTGVSPQSFHDNGVSPPTFHSNAISPPLFHSNAISPPSFHNDGVSPPSFHNNGDLSNSNLASQFNLQQEQNKLTAFYTLLSSINSNLYQSANHIPQGNQQNLAYDINSFPKKIIIDYENARNNDNNNKIANKYSRKLVTQVALNKAARVDSEVIAEASRYTEWFVETLFDTAQVIARHSNGSSSSDSTNENINLSDITSAVKLLPSKLPKILK